MRDDPIVEEMRANGQAFTLRYSNDLGRICRDLREKSAASGHKIVNRDPKRLVQKAVS